jgi:hypothetical protein
MESDTDGRTAYRWRSGGNAREEKGTEEKNKARSGGYRKREQGKEAVS